MTRAEDVRFAVELGVDAIGVILHADSARTISVAEASEIRRHIPAFVTMVGVFVDCPADQLNAMINEVAIDLVQLHGDESVAEADKIDRPYIKAIRAKSPDYVCQQINQHTNAKAVLIDAYKKGMMGGTGTSIDAECWPQKSDVPLILAGGLNAENIGQAIARYHPFAVDVSSGIESTPGIKDASLMRQLVNRLATVSPPQNG